MEMKSKELILKLISLKLKNFKGAIDCFYEFNGKNCRVIGNNATGKTTILDGFLWLLFDKDSQGKTDFEIKTIGIEATEVEVEGRFLINNKPLTLKKIYKEKWTKKQNTGNKILTGHTTDYYIDDVPIEKIKEYKVYIASIISENHFKLLTQATYFNTQLHWTERRKILFDISDGNIPDQDIINSDPSLKNLTPILDDKRIDDYKKIIKARQAKINGILKETEARVDENTRKISKAIDINGGYEKTCITTIDENIQHETGRINQLKTGGIIAEKKNEIALIESKLFGIETSYKKKYQQTIDSLELQKKQLINQLSSSIEEKESLQKISITLQEKSKQNIIEMEHLREIWDRTFNQEFDLKQDTSCYVCNRPYESEELEKKFDKAKKIFNIEKANKLEAITKNGKKIKEENLKLEDEFFANKNQIQKSNKKIEVIQDKIDRLNKEIKSLNIVDKYIDDLEYKKLLNEKEVINLQLRSTQSNTDIEIQKSNKKIEELNKGRELHQERLNIYNAAEESKKRIEELKDEEKKLATEYEKLEKELFLCEQFSKQKVSLLEEKINSKFSLVKWKLFHQNINGGIDECCEAMYNNVPYSTGLNNGMRINVGLDIIDTLSDFYGVYLPCFIDNAEAVTETELFPLKTQMIKLIVPRPPPKIYNPNTGEFEIDVETIEKNKKLRIELEDENERNN